MSAPREPVSSRRPALPGITIPWRGALARRQVWRTAGVLLIVAVLAGVVADSQWAGARRHDAGRAGGTEPVAVQGPAGTALPAGLVLKPGNGTTSAGVTAPVTVSSGQSILDSVTLTSADGRAVPGVFGADRHTWHSTTPLAYDTRYALAAATGGGTKAVSAFRTVKPANLTLPYLRANTTTLLTDRETFGVGQPVVVWFDEEIPDRAAAQRALRVSTDPPVDGAWHWFNSHEVHWRPRTYWKPGTRVTVTARTYGVHFGHGLYGQSDATASFTIGRSQIAIADDRTFHIQVFIDGKLVRTIPTAMGLHTSVLTDKGLRIDYRTHSGVHVVLDRQQVVRMNSASYGLTGAQAYDELVYWTTHISYSGEYVHAAPWSVAQQGNSDASHGCLNVNTQNAIWFFNTFIPGDIVEVRNTGLPLDPTDGLGDWTLSWTDWVKGSALPYRPAVRPPTRSS